MGWSGGSDVAREMVTAILKHVPEQARRRAVYRRLIDVLESQDWDTQPEAKGIDDVFDQLLWEDEADRECNRTGVHPIHQR